MLRTVCFRLRFIGVSCFMLFILLDARAQYQVSFENAEWRSNVRPLRVGDRVPEDFWTRQHLFYVDGDTVRKPLNGYKDKILLFDFWATWCGSCIINIPVVDSLFSDVPSGKILYVTSDNYETVREFRERDIVARHVDMDIILEDKILKDYFRHDYIPHYVIVGEGGQVRAQVNEVEMDRGLISAVKDNPHLIIENEHTTEGKTQPLFLADRYGKSTDYMYSFFRMGFDPTYGGANIKRRNDNGIYSITLANTSLKTLVTEIAKLYADSFRLEFTPSFVEGMEHIGKQDFSYEFAVPEGEEGAFFDRLIDDVSRYITIRIDPRTRKQEVLTISSRTIMDKGARTKLARDIGEKLENAWTVIDYTDSYSKENLLVEGNDINSIREFLAKKGYLLEKKTISLPYIVVGK